MRECMDEGVLQSYFDGELSSEMMERVAKHAAACAPCTAALREIESESLLMSEAFEPELSLAVPTERLRARLDAAIAELRVEQAPVRAQSETKGSRVRGWFAALAAPFSFVPQHAVGFASLFAILTFGALFAFIVMRPATTDLKMAKNAETPDVLAEIQTGPAQVKETSGQDSTTNEAVVAPAVDRAVSNPVSFTNAGFTRRAGTTATPTPTTEAVAATTAPSVRLLPGERDYLKTIASLETAISTEGSEGLRPGLRAEYERNLRVIDEAIAQTRAVAQRNPNDKDATDFLLTAYQSKVELMNTVAEQAQLVSAR